MSKKHVVVLDIISLTPKMLKDPELTPNIQKLLQEGKQAKVKPVFPAVTGTMQATYITGQPPKNHGIISNGIPDKENKEITMWNQKMTPIQGKKLWEKLKEKDPDAETAVLFWQFSKLTTADIVVTPAPIHLDDEMILWCDSKPEGLYESLKEKQGEFDLKTFWGPFSSLKSSEWIANAAIDVLDRYRPRLSLVYLPNIDYNAQKFGPDSEQSRQSVKEIDSVIGQFNKDLEQRGLKDDTCLVILSEYAFKSVQRPVEINRILRREGYISVKEVKNMEFHDLEKSKAFALADHQLAHIYIQDQEDISKVKDLLMRTEGIAEVWGEEEKQAHQINHERSGDLIAIAEKDSWFTYYWWLDNEKAPSFSKNVDIHRKPGYDPVELFIDPETKQISLEPNNIKGSHGLPPTTEDDLVSMIVTDKEFDLPDFLEATDVHNVLLELALQGGRE